MRLPINCPACGGVLSVRKVYSPESLWVDGPWAVVCNACDLEGDGHATAQGAAAAALFRVGYLVPCMEGRPAEEVLSERDQT